MPDLLCMGCENIQSSLHGYIVDGFTFWLCRDCLGEIISLSEERQRAVLADIREKQQGVTTP